MGFWKINQKLKFGNENVVYWLQIGFAGNLKSCHDFWHRDTIG